MIRIRLIHIIVRATLAVFSPVLRECFEPDEEDQSIVLPDVSTQTLVQIQSLLFGGAHRVNVPSLDLMSALSCLGLNVLTRGQALHKEAKPPRQFICPLCGQYFASIPEVQFHVKESHVITESRGSHDNANSSSTTHTHEIETINHLGTMDEKKFKCLHCDKTFSSKAQFTYHTNIHLGLKPYTCLQCKKSFTQPTHLKIHLRIHDGEKNYMCSVCGKTFSIASNLRKHISIHERDIEEDRRQKSQDKENKKDLVSTSVSENLSTFDSYVGSGSYSCTNEKKLIQHEKKKNGNDHVCSHCNKSFISKSKLTKHVLIHTGEKPYQCTICQKAFTQKSHVSFHTRSVHNKGAQRKYQCMDCGKSCASNGALSKHKMLHSNDRPFQCALCPKKFVQKSHLKVHEVQHTGERPFLCLDCGKGFSTKQHLKAHQELHTGTQQWYPCSECDTKYRRQTDLATHVRIHTGETPYHCRQIGCGKSFRSLRSLENHERVHSGTKPYQCATCQKLFTTSAGLRQHFKHNIRCQNQAKPGCFKMKTLTDE